MIPVTQTIFHDDAEGRPGNCWPACIASVLDLDLEAVPHFVENTEPGGWWFDSVKWARERGGDLVELARRPVTFPLGAPGALGIATAQSPRGDFLHAVVVDLHTGDTVHDPHPSRAGLVGPIVDVCGVR